MRILIVDDNVMNRQLLHSLIDDFSEFESDVPLSVDEAENGLIAVEQTRKEEYGLILMDIMMPKMDGIEATKEIRTFDSDVPIIGISGATHDDDQAQILAAGAQYCLVKPLNMKKLFEHLRHYIAIQKQ